MKDTYVTAIPKTVPPRRVLVHNHIKPGPILGERGLRAWLADPDPKRWERCPCRWEPKLPEHFRVKGIPTSIRKHI